MNDITKIDNCVYGNEYNHLLDKITNMYNFFKREVELFNTKLYWRIGKEILAVQAKYALGEKIIHKLASDLGAEFNDFTVFSVENLKNMRKFAHLYRDEIIENPLFYVDWNNVKAFLQNINNYNLIMLNSFMLNSHNYCKLNKDV